LTYTPLNGSKIRCQLVDTALCATVDTVNSNILSFAVQPAPDTTAAVPNGIKVYPDPAKDMLTLTNLALTDQWQTLDIYNLQGRLVIANINVSGDTQITINVSALAPGYYICRLTGAKGQAYVKFLKF
jgi:Secretion system C-terminal sorting domain